MKILLLGEYSGYFTNLKIGLEELGHDVTLASTCDNWKKIEGTNYILYNTSSNSKFGAFFNLILSPLMRIRDLFNYDVVQIVCSGIYHHSINGLLMKLILKHSKKTYVSVAGNCYSVYKSWRDGLLDYYVYDDNPDSYSNYLGESWKSKLMINQENYVYENVDGIISIQYEYALGVRNRHNFMGTIQLPIECKDINYTPNIIHNGKIRIAHGIIKEKFKGTSYIIQAMNIIKQRYPDQVELMIDGKMPLKDYLRWLSSANILIDQCKEHAYGMNAMYAMAMGKIVLGGATELSLKEHNLEYCPVFHIEPNVDQIVEQLERLIMQKDRFEELGYESRKFVEEFHDCKKVAERYLEFWDK